MFDYKFYLIKFSAIAYITILYVFISYNFTKINKSMLKYIGIYQEPSDFKKTKTLTFTIRLLLEITLISISAFIIRKLVRNIPFPLNNVYGFTYSRLKEFTHDPLLSEILLLNESNIIPNVKLLNNKLLYFL